MISINVFSEEKAWSKRLKNKDIFFKKICKAFPKKYKFLNKKISLSLLLSNNKKIKILNKKFRNKETGSRGMSTETNCSKRQTRYNGKTIQLNYPERPSSPQRGSRRNQEHRQTNTKTERHTDTQTDR